MNNLNQNKRLAIFLAPGYEMAEAVITIDLLRRAEIDLDVVSITDELAVSANHNLIITADKLIKTYDFSKCSGLILPGGQPGVNNLFKNPILINQIKQFAQDKTKLLAAICAAPQILGKLGLLNNKKITFYPGCDEGLDYAVKTNEKVVVDDNIVTGKSPGCAFEFALKIIEIVKNSATKDLVAAKLEF